MKQKVCLLPKDITEYKEWLLPKDITEEAISNYLKELQDSLKIESLIAEGHGGGAVKRERGKLYEKRDYYMDDKSVPVGEAEYLEFGIRITISKVFKIEDRIWSIFIVPPEATQLHGFSFDTLPASSRQVFTSLEDFKKTISEIITRKTRSRRRRHKVLQARVGILEKQLVGLGLENLLHNVEWYDSYYNLRGRTTLLRQKDRIGDVRFDFYYHGTPGPRWEVVLNLADFSCDDPHFMSLLEAYDPKLANGIEFLSSTKAAIRATIEGWTSYKKGPTRRTSFWITAHERGGKIFWHIALDDLTKERLDRMKPTLVGLLI